MRVGEPVEPGCEQVDRARGAQDEQVVATGQSHATRHHGEADDRDRDTPPEHDRPQNRLVGGALLARGDALPRGSDLAVLSLAGCGDLLATALYGLANTHGALSIVSVVGSLYPIATILLARAVLHERVRRVQAAGVFAALTGVALIAVG